jgi:hypothetical protein
MDKIKNMKYTYTVEKKNFLNFQLYHVSQSAEFNIKLKRQPLVIMLINLAIAVYFAVDKNYFISMAFVAIGILWYFLYPERIKRLYESRFENDINVKFEKHFNREAELEITNEYLRTSDKGGSSQKSYNDILKIVHLPKETLIIFKNQQTFILPKEKTENYAEMVNELNTKAKQETILVENLPNWKW